MKPSDIKVGHTYKNRGAGKTTRKVLGIGIKYKPDFWFSSSNKPAGVPGVLFEQGGKTDTLYISSFAQWCGKDVTSEGNVKKVD